MPNDAYMCKTFLFKTFEYACLQNIGQTVKDTFLKKTTLGEHTLAVNYRRHPMGLEAINA